MKKDIRIVGSCMLMMFVFSAVCISEEKISSSKRNMAIDQKAMMAMRTKLKDELAEAKKGKENSVAIRRIRRELAKNGDSDERLLIIAKLKVKDPATQLMAVQDAEYVGGRDMVEALALLLNDDTGYKSVASERVGPQGERMQGDLVFEPVAVVAAKAIANLVEDPPVPPIGKDKKSYSMQDVEQWRQWWKKNKSKYEVKGQK
jgi:hypothetical protein